MALTARPILPRLATAAALLGVAGCAHSLSPQQAADQNRSAACSAQADRIYRAQNRYLMSEGDQSASPFSSNGVVGTPDRGLSDAYRRDRMVDDCIRAGGPAPNDGAPDIDGLIARHSTAGSQP